MCDGRRPALGTGCQELLQTDCVDFQATDVDGNVLFSESSSKQGKMKGLKGDPIVCTFGDTFEENGETFIFSGTVTGIVTPRR